jgi:hypothetical protein
MKTKIEKFLERFPKDAGSWAYATDEIRDLSRESREHLEELDGIIVEPVDFRALKTPAEWNTVGRENILTNFDRMRPSTRQVFYNRFREWFESEKTMTKRELLIQEIHSLHAKAKQIPGGNELLISNTKLASHLYNQPMPCLNSIKRFLVAYINADNA